jgi:hypothetical protein
VACAKVGREDWYLTSGGMCQRNSCRIMTRRFKLPDLLGGTVEFVAR